jgi:hypothetical protein
VETAIVAFVLVTLSYEVHETAGQGCLFEKTAWVALEVLRPLILAAWQSMPAYLCEGAGILQHVVQIVASIGPRLGVVVGLV